MISSEIRVFISTRRRELKTLHRKENKNRKEAERIKAANTPKYGSIVEPRIGYSWVTGDPGTSPEWTSGISPGILTPTLPGYPRYRTEMTPKGMKVITATGPGEEYSTFITNDEVESSGLTESKAMDLLRGLKF